MSKIRMNTGLASIILVASIFAGWQGMLLAIILLFAFCDVEDTVKNVAISGADNVVCGGIVPAYFQRN